jgi:hypothetical protein
LWGDSHAQALLAGMNELSLKYKSSGLIISKGGVGPLPNLGNSKGYSDKEYREIISYIDSHKEIQTVLLAASWNGYAKNPLFYDQLEKTIRNLLVLHRNVILIGDVPHMKKDIPRVVIMACRTGRPIKEILGSDIYDSLPTRQEYIEENKDVNRIFALLNNNDNVRFIYPDRALYDKKGDNYRVFMNDKLLYIDTGHLSSAGSIFVSSVFVPYFQNGEL